MSQLKVDSIVPTAGVATGQGGGIIQTITESTNAILSTTSTTSTEISSDLRATIVPKNANNIIIIRLSIGVISTTSNNVATIRILKNGTDFVEAPLDTAEGQGNGQVWTNNENMIPMSITVKELAGNTNSRYYSPFFRTNSSTVHINSYRIAPAFRTTTNITVMEVSG